MIVNVSKTRAFRSSIICCLLLFVAPVSLFAQDAISGRFSTRYEVFSAVGGRIWTGRDAGIEAAVGTLISSFTLNAGVFFPAPSLFNDTRPSWTVLLTYFKGADGRWFGLSGMYGLLQLGTEGLHMFVRGGASLMMKSALGQSSNLNFYPLPAFDVGLSWGF
jgi:hypothetical protein